MKISGIIFLALSVLSAHYDRCSESKNIDQVKEEEFQDAEEVDAAKEDTPSPLDVLGDPKVRGSKWVSFGFLATGLAVGFAALGYGIKQFANWAHRQHRASQLLGELQGTWRHDLMAIIADVSKKYEGFDVFWQHNEVSIKANPYNLLEHPGFLAELSHEQHQAFFVILDTYKQEYIRNRIAAIVGESLVQKALDDPNDEKFDLEQQFALGPIKKELEALESRRLNYIGHVMSQDRNGQERLKL